MQETNSEQNPVAEQSVNPIPSQSVSSIATPKKSGSKTVYIVLGVIFVFMILCCIGCFGTFYFIDLNSKRNLKMVENSNMIFYYPESYESKQAESGNFIYQKKQSNTLEGNDNIRSISNDYFKDIDFSSDSKCEDSAQKIAKQISLALYLDTKDLTISNKSFTNISGSKTTCSFTLELVTSDQDKNSVKVFNSYKLIESNGKKVGASSFYEENTPKEEQDQINRSMQLFSNK